MSVFPRISQVNRREFWKTAVGGALGYAALNSSGLSAEESQSGTAKVYLALDGPASPKDDDLLFLKQVGADRVCVRGTKPEDRTADGLLSIKKKYADAGLSVSDFDNGTIANGLTDIVLGRPGRDEAIEAYKTWVHTLGQAGIERMKLSYDAISGLSSGHAETRGATDHDIDLNSSELTGSRMTTKGPANALLFDREYKSEEIWANYKYFIKRLAPVAEQANVQIGLQPNEAPSRSLFGVARIFSTFADCKKALAIAGSPKVGMSLSCGAWLAGGPAMGIDPPGAIRYFASRKKLFQVHFRGTSSILPHYHETFIDDSYYDLYKIMKALVEVRYEGIATLDHVVPMVGGARRYEAFGLGYLRAMLQCAERGYHA